VTVTLLTGHLKRLSAICYVLHGFAECQLLSAYKSTTRWRFVHPSRRCSRFAVQSRSTSGSDDGSNGTLAQLDFRYSAISPLGLKVIRNRGEAKIELMLQILMVQLRNYCERGEMASSGRIARLIVNSDALDAADRIRLFLNTLAASRKPDSFRQRYMKELAAGFR